MSNAIDNLITQPWSTYVLFAAVRLKVFSILSSEEMPTEEIAEKCGAVPRLLKALLDACVAMGLINRTDDMYTNSQFSNTYLVEWNPLYLGDFINVLNMESKQWLHMPEVISGKKLPEEQGATGTYDHTTFIKGMNDFGMLGEAEALKNAVDLSGCRKMVDVGGGSGIYSVALCQKYPELGSVILDVRETLVISKELTEKYTERERIQFKEADITKDSLGENVDVVLLSDVIYDKSESLTILKSAWKCLRQGGHLVVRGYYVDPYKTDSLFEALFVLNILLFNPSREVMDVVSLPQCVRDTGFTDVKISALTERSSYLTARK